MWPQTSRIRRRKRREGKENGCERSNDATSSRAPDWNASRVDSWDNVNTGKAGCLVSFGGGSLIAILSGP